MFPAARCSHRNASPDSGLIKRPIAENGDYNENKHATGGITEKTAIGRGIKHVDAFNRELHASGLGAIYKGRALCKILPV